jgi:hypothetical protein
VSTGPKSNTWICLRGASSEPVAVVAAGFILCRTQEFRASIRPFEIKAFERQGTR